MQDQRYETIEPRKLRDFSPDEVYVVLNRYIGKRKEEFGYLLRTSPYVVSNEMGSEILEICDKKLVSEIVDTLYEKYDVERQQLEADILTFLQQLGAVGGAFFVSKKEFEKEKGGKF